ncbi:MAG: YIP1 family protein, partial [Gemmatimonadaceae bacterium]
MDAPPAPAPKVASRWEDFIDIFYAPSDVYARRANSGFGIPMLVVAVLLGVIGLANFNAMQPIMDAEFTRSTAAIMKQNPKVTVEMMEKGRAMGETFGKIGGFIFAPIAIFCVGLILWVVGKFVDAKQTLTAAIMVAAYAYVPRIAEQVLNGVQGLLMDPASLNGRLRLSLGVGRFLDPDTTSPMLLAIIGRLDVFTIWVTVL